MNYKNNLLHKIVVIVTITIYPLSVFSNNLSNYQLKSVSSHFYFYNFCMKDGELLIGSDHGILKFKKTSEIIIVDANQKGYVYLENNKLVTSNVYVNGNSTPEYTSLLPTEFKTKSIIGTIQNNTILIIAKGQLFIYKKGIYKYNTDLSIRSISKNYIGSYNGIYYKGAKSTNLKYTNGFIREYPDETFICYDGIYRINKTNVENYGYLAGEKFSNLNLGKAFDIYKVNSKEFLVFSNTGLFTTNLKDFAKKIISVKSGEEPRFINTMNRNEIPVYLFFSQKNTIYRYTLSSGELIKTLQIDSNFGDIEDCYFDPMVMGKIYIITKDKLLQANATARNTYNTNILNENLDSNHQIINYDDNLLITSNSGLSLYNLATKKLSKNIIRDEFNKRAVYVTDGVVYLGTISGYYELNQTQINQLVNLAENNEDIQFKVSQNENYIVIFILGSLCLILTILSSILWKKNKLKIEKKLIFSKTEIINYIEENIESVTIYNICENFKITSQQLITILNNEKPGELIRKKRIEIVTRMRKQKKDLETIAKATGFSVSYLKKIKG